MGIRNRFIYFAVRAGAGVCLVLEYGGLAP